ncbi:hypothetical protein ACOSQ3_011937 [Xanthoceras sorbifolium]
MMNEIKPCLVLFITLAILSMKNFVVGAPIVPCYFIFGDSLVDSGNNNDLQTSAKANYGPYGIDFRKGPTGRFTNGRTTVDLIAERLGFENYIPPFATAKGVEILKGVNYASGSAGILDETGKNQGVCISLKKQVANYQTTVSHIVELLGSNKLANEHLNKCLYSFNIGSNDYINNYFMPQFFNSSKLYTPEEYAQLLVNQFSDQIRTIYKQGARKMYMVGAGLIGCTPNATLYYGTNGSLCVKEMNKAARLFNNHLRLAVEGLNKEFIDAKFVYVDQMKMMSQLSSSPPTVAIKGCCEVGENGLCIPDKPPCRNRNLSLFWDSFHPTEVVNTVQANKTLTSMDPSESYPINVLQLAQLPTTKT